MKNKKAKLVEIQFQGRHRKCPAIHTGILKDPKKGEKSCSGGECAHLDTRRCMTGDSFICLELGIAPLSDLVKDRVLIDWPLGLSKADKIALVLVGDQAKYLSISSLKLYREVKEPND